MKKIKLIIVDLYGVVSKGSYWDTTFWLAKKFGLQPRDIYKILYHKYFNQAALGKISEKTFFTKALKDLKINLNWKIVREKHLSFQKPNRQVIKLCKNLQTQGYTVLLLSKNIPSHFNHTKKTFGLNKIFKHIYNTFDLKLPKASKKTVVWVLKKFKIKPEEIIFIDDQDFNLVEAKKMGVNTTHYKNFLQLKRDINKYINEKAGEK